MGACKLSRRSGTAKLTASTTAGAAGAELEVLTAHSVGQGDGDWRIIDLWSDESTPWVAKLVWSGGGGATRSALLDVPKCTRVCVHATMIQVFGANLSTSANIQARAAIADGQCDTENQSTVRGATDGQAVGGGAGNVDVIPPPWAKFVRLELSDSTLLPTTFIELLDVNATVRGRYAGNTQPQPGAPIGDAATVRLVLPAGTYAYRVVFLLHL
ncbi:MAG: hypothetical protein Q8P41_18330 [Pseudomonadota bacterium]|nr:hypothetical protein [Pseudomonadota bacterium]